MVATKADQRAGRSVAVTAESSAGLKAVWMVALMVVRMAERLAAHWAASMAVPLADMTAD